MIYGNLQINKINVLNTKVYLYLLLFKFSLLEGLTWGFTIKDIKKGKNCFLLLKVFIIKVEGRDTILAFFSNSPNLKVN